MCVAFISLTLLCGCQSVLGKPWGRDVKLIPTGERVKWAALRALTDPYTLVPAASAAVFAASDFDEQVSDWARRETPLFGSKEGAKRAGAVCRNITIAGAGVTALATPSGPRGQWAVNKAKGMAVQAVGAVAAGGIARFLKEETDVVRPNGKDDLSFPSFISAQTAAWAAAGRRNARALPIDWRYRAGMEASFATLTAFTAWSRVESGSHWPSDVLAGVAIGNFTSIFIQDLFLGPSWRDFQLGIAPWREQAQFNLSFTVSQ